MNIRVSIQKNLAVANDKFAMIRKAELSGSCLKELDLALFACVFHATTYDIGRAGSTCALIVGGRHGIGGQKTDMLNGNAERVRRDLHENGGRALPDIGVTVVQDGSTVTVDLDEDTGTA